MSEYVRWMHAERYAVITRAHKFRHQVQDHRVPGLVPGESVIQGHISTSKTSREQRHVKILGSPVSGGTVDHRDAVVDYSVLQKLQQRRKECVKATDTYATARKRTSNLWQHKFG